MKDIIFDPDKFWTAFCEWENKNRKEFEAEIERMSLNAIELRPSSLDRDKQKLVDRFLTWPLPESVCSDRCVTEQGEGRTGTNLLTADEALQMIEYLFEKEALKD